MEEKNIFKKVSFNQFYEDWIKLYGNSRQDKSVIKQIYETIKMPKNKNHTIMNKDCYELFLPFSIDIPQGQNIVIPTGIYYDGNDFNFFLTGINKKLNYTLNFSEMTVDSSDNYQIMVHLFFIGTFPEFRMNVKTELTYIHCGKICPTIDVDSCYDISPYISDGFRFDTLKMTQGDSFALIVKY